MMSFLVAWYALGWAALLIYACEFRKLTLVDIVITLLLGGFSFLVYSIGWLLLHATNPVIWKEPRV